MESAINILLSIAGIYLLAGVLFSIFFLWKGLVNIDPAAKGSGWFFKVLIFPGLCFFWILFLKKWIKNNSKN